MPIRTIRVPFLPVAGARQEPVEFYKTSKLKVLSRAAGQPGPDGAGQKGHGLGGGGLDRCGGDGAAGVGDMVVSVLPMEPVQVHKTGFGLYTRALGRRIVEIGDNGRDTDTDMRDTGN